MQKFIEVGCRAFIQGVTERELVRKDRIVGLHEELVSKECNASIAVNTGQKIESFDVLTPYDEIKAQLMEPERNVRELTETIIQEISKVFREIEEEGCDITENDFKNRIRGKLLKRLSGED